jgi:2-succinyl-5-enolpyruvyl-6-hydroxy-3-cyclohexene-1-carboxylate synthase
LHCAGLALDTSYPGGGGKPRVYSHTHFDERGLAIWRWAGASRQPVAVIVTSGTATANLYPALLRRADR